MNSEKKLIKHYREDIDWRGKEGTLGVWETIHDGNPYLIGYVVWKGIHIADKVIEKDKMTPDELYNWLNNEFKKCKEKYERNKKKGGEK